MIATKDFKNLELAFSALRFIDYDSGGRKVHRVEYNVENGKAFSDGLLWIPEVSVARTSVRLNDKHVPAKWKRHHHNELELLYVISGGIDLFVCSIENVIKIGRCSAGECNPETCPSSVRSYVRSGASFVIQIDSIHSAIFKEDTEFIAISVPASNQFPGSNEREVPSARA